MNSTQRKSVMGLPKLIWYSTYLFIFANFFLNHVFFFPNIIIIIIIIQRKTYFVMALSKMVRNCLSEFWYITFTLLISTIRKYKIEPRDATARNSSRAMLIFRSVCAETLSFWLTSSAVTLVSCSTWIRASSSTRDPWNIWYQSLISHKFW